MIDVPDHVENPAAYVDGAYRRIRENARKGRGARWFAEDPSREALAARIAQAGERGDAFMRKMDDAIREWGSLSPKQEEAVKASFARSDERRAAARAKDAGSQHVGEVGKRGTFKVTVRKTLIVGADDWCDGFRIILMADEAGNVLVYKGDALKREVQKEGSDIYTVERPADGQTIEIVASVKSHGERDGIKQTILARPKWSV